MKITTIEKDGYIAERRVEVVVPPGKWDDDRDTIARSAIVELVDVVVPAGTPERLHATITTNGYSLVGCSIAEPHIRRTKHTLPNAENFIRAVWGDDVLNEIALKVASDLLIANR